MSSVKKVIEVLASSEKSFEDALKKALQEASTTVHGIKSIYVKDQSCRVRDNQIVEYRITAKITFEVMHKWDPSGQQNAPEELRESPAGQNGGGSEENLGDGTNSGVVGTGGGAPDYSNVNLHAAPQLPRPVEPGGSATEAASGGGYSG